MTINSDTEKITITKPNRHNRHSFYCSLLCRFRFNCLYLFKSRLYLSFPVIYSRCLFYSYKINLWANFKLFFIKKFLWLFLEDNEGIIIILLSYVYSIKLVLSYPKVLPKVEKWQNATGMTYLPQIYRETFNNALHVDRVAKNINTQTQYRPTRKDKSLSN